jgi:hypothetical protein
MAIVTALHDPLTVLVADDLAYVVTPNDDGTYGGSPGAWSVMRPWAREVVGWTGVDADLLAHVPSAPRARPTRIMMTPTSMIMMVRTSLRARSDKTKHCRCSHENTHHGCSLLRRAIKKPLRWIINNPGRQVENDTELIPTLFFKGLYVAKIWQQAIHFNPFRPMHWAMQKLAPIKHWH